MSLVRVGLPGLPSVKAASPIDATEADEGLTQSRNECVKRNSYLLHSPVEAESDDAAPRHFVWLVIRCKWTPPEVVSPSLNTPRSRVVGDDVISSTSIQEKGHFRMSVGRKDITGYVFSAAKTKDWDASKSSVGLAVSLAAAPMSCILS